jgi:D-sedoheptulose 7-phosphate isomerase
MPDNEIQLHVAALREALAALDSDDLWAAGQELLECYARGGTLYLVGNGGSASTASHFACDLSKGTRQPAVPRFRAVALTDNVPLMTAWGNDASFDRIFAEQLMPLVRPHDLLLAISASGSSPNVLEALRAAREAGARTMAWTGATGGSAAPLADTVIRVPATTIEQVEDAHMVLAHALTVFMRSRLRERSPEEAGAAGP